MADVTFEKNFAQVVDNQVAEKLPALLPYRVGFELVDKNDEGTQAAGLVAFIVNGLWVYVPVFFVKGQIKGLDAMYIKQKNMVVPASDKWITSLKDRGTEAVNFGGAVSPASRDDQGSGDTPLNQLAFAFSGKKAEAESEMFPKDLMDRMTNQTLEVWPLDLRIELPLMPKEASELFINTMMQNSDFANAVLHYYTPDSIAETAAFMQKAASVMVPDETPESKKAVVISKITQPEAKGLSDIDKKKLMEQGTFVKDERKSVSAIFQARINNKALTTPGHPGIYEMLMADGQVKPFVVIPGMRRGGSSSSLMDDSSCSPCCGSSDEDSRPTILIPLESPDYFISGEDTRKLLGRPATDLSEYAPVKGKLGIKATKSAVAGMLTGGSILLLQLPGKCLILRAKSVWNNKTGKSDYRPEFYCNGTDVTLDFTGKPGVLKQYGSVVNVPEDVKIFTELPYEKRSEKGYRFGGLEAVSRLLLKEANVHPLTVLARTGDRFAVRSAHGVVDSLNKTAALERLTNVEGIYGGQAQQILKEASRAKEMKAEYFIKYAEPYIYPESGNVHSPVAAKSQFGPVVTNETVGGRAILPADAIRQITEAAKSGNRQVFDAVSLTNIIMASDSAETRKELMANMLKGLDANGRLLMDVYWHPDQYEERFGTDKVQELENQAKQVFKSLGDLLLFLKERNVMLPSMSESDVGTMAGEIGDTE